MKKRLSLILAALMAASALCACGDGSDGAKPAQTTAPSGGETAAEETEPEDVRLESGLPDMDFGGYEFHIMIHNTITNDFKAEELTGEPIDDAEYNRMITVQEKGNCVIKPIVVSADNRQGQKEVSKSVQAGTNDYDLVCLSGYSSCNAIVANALADLNKVEHLDLSKPWWDQYVTQECTFGGSVFQMTGDLSIGDNRATFAIYFNKKMAENYNLPNMYDMVDSMTWTIDNFRTFAEAIDGNLDTDGDGGHVNDKDDLYGIYIWDDIMMGIVNASGIKCCTVNPEGEIELTLYSEKFVQAFDKFTAYAYNKDVTCAYQRNGYDADYGVLAFNDGRALFYMANLGAATSFRDMQDDFGIMPLPLFDESQERYYNSAASWSISLYSIPNNSWGDEEFARAGWITQNLAYESLYTLTPAYYEVTLQNKVARDEESAKMLDLIFSTRTYDFGWYFEIGGYNESIMNLLRSYKSDVSSMYEKGLKKANKNLDKYNTAIAEIIG